MALKEWLTKYFIMEILDYIFLLSLLSVGYGKVPHPECNTGNEPPISLETTSTPFKSTFQLVLNLNRQGNMKNQTCYWRFMFGASYQEIQIIFEEFRLKNSYNCLDEYLEIRFPNYKDKTMEFCGTSYPKELQLTNDDTDGYFDIVLHSNLDNIDFNIKVQNDLLMTSKESELSVSDIPMYIYSPGYPNVYYKYVNMTWTFTANDLTRRIMFEFLWLKLEGGSCNFDFIEIKGDKTNFLTCGYKSRFLVAANDSSVTLMFESDGFSEHDGFVVKYYTVPYPNYKESCIRDVLKLTAIPFIPQMLTVTKTNDKYCRWIIEPDKNSTNHVIVFEIVSYFTSFLKCNQKLYIHDTFSTKMAADYYQKYIPSANITDIGGTTYNCINKAVQYYRSMSSSITVRLIDSTDAFLNVIGNMTFSYYSVPRDVYSNKVIRIGYRPSYIWLLKPRYWYNEHEILLKAESGCIRLKLLDEQMRTFDDNIGNYLEIYDGDSKEAQDLVNGCDENRNGSVISGTQPYMFIRVKHPSTSFQLQPRLLEITSTDECQGYVQKMVVPRSQGFIKIYNPKHSLSVPKNLVCHYEVSSTDEDTVFSIQGRSNRVNTCNNEIDFYNSDNLFYSWCFTKDFSILTKFNKIRFTLKTDDWFHDTVRYSVTVTEEIKPKVISSSEVPPGQCSGRQTLKPQVDQSYEITSPYYPQAYPANLHCEWLIIAPGGYEISLILTSKMDRPSCSDTLKLFKGRDAWIEFGLFDSCSNVNDKVFVSNGGVFLVQFITDRYSYNSYSDTGFEIRYTLIKAEPVADLQLTLREQTFTFESSWEMSGTHLLRRFVKPSGFYSNYRIVLYITEVDNNFCRTSSISFTNVIMDSEYYEKIHLCDTVRSYKTLYGSQDEINMDIYVDKDYSNKPYTITIAYQLEKIPDCSAGRPLLLFAEVDFNTFTSPNYPGHYNNNQYCQWKILASEDYVLYLEVVFSDLGYSSNANYRDYVAIYDGGDRYSRLLGKFTGSTRVMYISTSDVVFIEFYSDATEINTGFKMKYRKEKSRTTSQTSGSSSNTIAIVAGCIAAAIFTMVFCIVCGVCCKRKRANGERNRARSSSVVYNNSNTVYVLSPVISNNTTALPPPPYSDLALDNLGFTQLTQPQGPATDESPPPYSDLPSYEDSKQYEIPNSRSISLYNTLNNTMESGISSYEQLGNTQEGVRSPQRHGSQDELHVYDNSSDQLRGIDNPALSISTIV